MAYNNKMLLLHQFNCYIIFLCEFPIQLNSTFTIDVKLDSCHGSNAVVEWREPLRVLSDYCSYDEAASFEPLITLDLIVKRW